MVNVATNPLVHVIAAENMPILWQGESGGKAQLLADTSGPDMIELGRWTCNRAKSLAQRGILLARLNCFMSGRAR